MMNITLSCHPQLPEELFSRFAETTFLVCKRHGFERSEIHVMEIPIQRYAIGGQVIGGQPPKIPSFPIDPNNFKQTQITLNNSTGKKADLVVLAQSLGREILKRPDLFSVLKNPAFGFSSQQFHPHWKLPSSPLKKILSVLGHS